MQRHKILSDIGIDELSMVQNLVGDEDSRNGEWAAEREKYGFDERETWNMDESFVQWLLERLIRYKDISTSDLKWHKHKHRGKRINKGQAIDRMVFLCINLHRLGKECDSESEIQYDQYWKELCTLWMVWGRNLWW